jgi:hypothetical protein
VQPYVLVQSSSNAILTDRLRSRINTSINSSINNDRKKNNYPKLGFYSPLCASQHLPSLVSLPHNDASTPSWPVSDWSLMSSLRVRVPTLSQLIGHSLQSVARPTFSSHFLVVSTFLLTQQPRVIAPPPGLTTLK